MFNTTTNIWNEYFPFFLKIILLKTKVCRGAAWLTRGGTNPVIFRARGDWLSLPTGTPGLCMTGIRFGKNSILFCFIVCLSKCVVQVVRISINADDPDNWGSIQLNLNRLFNRGFVVVWDTPCSTRNSVEKSVEIQLNWPPGYPHACFYLPPRYHVPFLFGVVISIKAIVLEFCSSHNYVC